MGYQVSVGAGLSAYFNQPSGPSKPGVDWAVRIGGDWAGVVLVRTYFSSDPPQDSEKQGLAEKALRFVSAKLAQGWKPGSEQFLEATEVTLGPEVSAVQKVAQKKPWWKIF